MIIGTPYTLNDVRNIENLGFTHTSAITILGFNVDEKLENLDSNWKRIINSLQIISNTWSSYRPSITTRIDLIKMFFLSKLSYIASCLLPSQTTIDIVICENLIRFVRSFDKHKFCENKGPPRIMDKEMGRGTDPISKIRYQDSKNREGVGTR